MTETKTNGLVLRSTGSWYTVLLDSGETLECRLKGKFRMKGIKSTNPVAVGDKVEVESPDTGSPVIKTIFQRENYLIRKATRLSKQSHIIAANIDQAVIVVTLAFPRTSTGFIDRFLVTAEAYHIPAIIIFNKTDLYDDELSLQHKAMTDLYERIGYNCINTSAKTGENIDKVKAVLKEKISLFSGHSGVGKSAIANAVDSSLNLRTGVISDVHNKGKHTTTFAEMHPISGGGFLVDTPGIKEFGLVDMEKVEIAQRFPEMRSIMHKCRFNNCTHVNEPGCAVKEAVEKGTIDKTRYRNYLGILDDDYWNENIY